MFSVVMPDKTVKDIKYIKKVGRTAIKLGDTIIAVIFLVSKGNYTVVVNGDNVAHPLLRSCDGLCNHYFCTKFALEVLGYWQKS